MMGVQKSGEQPPGIFLDIHIYTYMYICLYVYYLPMVGKTYTYWLLGAGFLNHQQDVMIAWRCLGWCWSGWFGDYDSAALQVELQWFVRLEIHEKYAMVKSIEFISTKLTMENLEEFRGKTEFSSWEGSHNPYCCTVESMIFLGFGGIWTRSLQRIPKAWRGNPVSVHLDSV